jgi:hypothetical protein
MLSGRVGGGYHVGWRRLTCVMFGMSLDEVLIARRPPRPDQRLRRMPGTGGRRASLEAVTPHDLRATRVLGGPEARDHGGGQAARRSNAKVTTPRYAREVDDRDAEIAASGRPTSCQRRG